METNFRTYLAVLSCAASFVVARATFSRQSKPNSGEQQTAERVLAEGRQVFESRCAGCHGLDARGGERAPDIATRAAVQRRTNVELTHIIKEGIPPGGMPGFATLDDSALTSLVRYLRFLQGRTTEVHLPGAPERGKAIFFGAGRCAECHVVSGQGGFIGSDLSSFARTRSADEIRDAITKPTADPRHSGMIDVSTKDGQRFSGMIRNEDNFSLQLQSLDGGFHFVLRSEIVHLAQRQESLMPSDYGLTLNNVQLNDLASFLMSVANDGKPAAPKKREDDEDE
jgi:cytochrome c oxidase cbb3-type subunit 3